MKKVKIKMGFAGIALSRLQTRKNEILLAMKGNKNFPATDPLVAEIEKTGGEFDDLLLRIKAGDRTLVPRRDVVTFRLISLLTDLGNDVTSVAKGDFEMLSSTGFGLYKSRTPKGPVTAPTGLTLTDEDLGGFRAKIKKVATAEAYLYEWTADPINESTEWTSVQVPFVTFHISGVVSGKKYWVRVGAVDKYANVVYCDAVSRVAQ